METIIHVRDQQVSVTVSRFLENTKDEAFTLVSIYVGENLHKFFLHGKTEEKFLSVLRSL